MTREAKVGLFMVVLMVGVFGFLIYKRVNRQPEIQADDQQIVDGTDSGENEKSSPPLDDDSQFLPREEKSRAGRDIERVAHKTEEFIEDTVEEVRTIIKEPGRRVALPLPTDLDSSVDEPLEEKAPDRLNQRLERDLPEVTDESFERVPKDLASEDTIESDDQRDVAASDEPATDDPFESKAQPVKELPVESGKRRLGRVDLDRLPDPVDERVEIRKPDTRIELREFDRQPESRQPDRRQEFKEVETQIESHDSQPDEIATESDLVEEPVVARPPTSLRPTNDRELPAFSAEERRKAAPSSLPDEDASFDSRATRSDEIDGDNYTIQQNDNFWTISRKRYGAGRYYMALALHNQQTIPDPRRMKPGTVIATPDVHVLERLYGASIPKAGTDDSSDSAPAVQTRAAVESGPWGFFLSEEGEPMYRVGKNDTLTDIAKTHLRRASRWVQIREMNRNVLRNGTELKIGTVLRLPADAHRDRVAETMHQLR